MINAELSAVKGEFVRSESGFRNWITKDGSAGPTGKAGFAAEPGRYHLYVSHACPWAHRTMIFRALKGLQDVISVSVVHPLMPDESWVSNPLGPKDHVSKGQGMALANIRERLELAFGALASLITHQSDDQFFAVLSLPYVKNTDH